MKHVALMLAPVALLLAACGGAGSVADSSTATEETLAESSAPAAPASSAPAAMFTPTGDDWYKAIYDELIVEMYEGLEADDCVGFPDDSIGCRVGHVLLPDLVDGILFSLDAVTDPSNDRMYLADTIPAELQPLVDATREDAKELLVAHKAMDKACKPDRGCSSEYGFFMAMLGRVVSDMERWQRYEGSDVPSS